MKLRDLVFRLSAQWRFFALSEWNRTTGKETPRGTYNTIGELEDYISGENWDIGWYDVVNVVPIFSVNGIQIVIARA